jgi:pyruvate kinase
MKKFIEAKRLRPHKTCALLLELRGREIRTSDVNENETVVLRPGQQLYIACDNPLGLSDSETIYCNFAGLPNVVRPNDIIYIDDGKIVCLVTECEEVSGLFY